MGLADLQAAEPQMLKDDFEMRKRLLGSHGSFWSPLMSLCLPPLIGVMRESLAPTDRLKFWGVLQQPPF